ncbi:fibronectin type III domain-containing protein [Spirosoma sp. BT702]|uniref:Fibronectin type III domain-containing protein n=1 Tax=Spirosoma profusum TaxID=2771354 RepID=A0A927AWD1_9BACT|nr:fibronectin type III domain-containing protein [Spirosoma profusum]MBD2705673.1 fibronectin type III domain-containing protein [Spirosoma profusum]
MRNSLLLSAFPKPLFTSNHAENDENRETFSSPISSRTVARFWRTIGKLFALYLLTVGYANAQCTAPYGPFSYGITYNTAQLYWYSTGAPQGYELDYRQQGNATWTTVPLTTNSYSLTNLAASTTYEWRARIYCGNNVFSTYTTTQTFTTTGCLAPTSPSNNGIANTTANLYWSSNGATYELDYQQQGAGTWTTIPVTTNYYSLTGLTTNTAYSWRVRSNCGTTTSAYTTPLSFTTGCQIPASPITSGVLAYSALLSWTNTNSGANTGATYEIDYRIQGASEWTTVIPPNNTYSYKLTGLNNNTTYQWRIRSNCGGGSLSGNTAVQTFTTVCNAPTGLNATSISFSSATLNYNITSAGATYEIDYRVQGTTNWTTVIQTNTQNYYFPLTGLSNNTAYDWRMRSNCGGALSANSSVQSFTTVCKLPTALSVKANSFAAAISWTAPATDIQYALQWRQGTGSWTTIPDITRAQYVLTGLTSGGAYQVQVQSVCGASSTTFTTPVSFTANCPAPATLAVTAQTFLPVTTRVFSWLNNSGVDYEVQWRPQGSATWNTSPLLNEYANDSYSIPNGYSNYKLNDLAAGVFEWQVRGVCENGATTAYTTGQSFTVIAPISASCNSAPPASGGATATFSAALLLWPGDASAVHEVRWRPQGSTTWNLATNLKTRIRAGTSINNGPSPALVLRNLQSNTTYEWQVRTLCPDNPNTTFGTLRTFTTSCASLSGVTTSEVASNKAMLRWDTNWSNLFGPTQQETGLTAQDLGFQFEVNWRQAGASTWNVVTGLTSTLFSLTGLANNTAYEWRVRNICSPTATTEFTTPLSFTTQCASVSVTSVFNNYCDMAIVYTNSVGISDGGNFNVRYRVVGGSSWSVQSFTNAGQVSLTGLTGNTNYEIQVQNNCGAGTQSSYSNSTTFNTQICSPTICTPAYSDYPSQTDISTDGATVYFNGTRPSFELRWRQSGTAGWTTVPISFTSGGTPSYRITGLTPGTNYDWQVRSTCSIPTDFSPITYFKTGCNIPFNLASSNIQSISAQLSYDGFGSGTSYEIRYRTGANAWVSVTTSNTSTYQLTGLTNNTTYEWQIRTLCSGGGTSSWSYSLFFTTVQCANPTNLFADRIDGTSARVNWFTPYTGATFTLQYRQQGNSTWTTVNNINGTSMGANYVASLTSYAVTSLSPQTVYEWQVLTNCGDGSNSSTIYQPLTFLTTAASGTGTCTSMITVQNGDWTNPATWSCNRVPTASDPVQVLHNVTVPASTTGRALRVTYGAAGKVTLGTSARIILAQ